uniref:Uncharacterized protein n=1 Tax=Chromera velia CCMP2878 TaxID=1169474 RepID=A0A0G4H0N1_9ALVE|eukprot:Cvel_24231.t1-p1 / transcript=Cvel_24231.t1 / gene=Cvel_24231 / organism=Chromera_velia_CCMP2878 / gene_product=hypothetical protein / transcript_product=hypothetical protein / location=Cvel_scaffold2591:23369-24301(-) / protein_length=311 / sequence_SO=supercontig / SO=protein_coding / is_pseudo=false
MAPAGGDGQMNEPAPMELCQIERSKKDEGGVGKDLFESLYGVGSWELREQIHCQSERPHSPSPQLNRLETGGQGNDFGGGSPGKAERQKQKRQEKKERKRQEKHEKGMLAVRQKKEMDSHWSPLPPISEGVEEPAVSSDGLTPSRQARHRQERTEAKNKEKERRRAAYTKPKTPVPPRDPLQHEYWEDVSFCFRLGREDLIPNVQGIGTADWHAFLARRGCRQRGETFYREMYGNGGAVMPCVPEVRPAVRQMRSVRTARTSPQPSISPQSPLEQRHQAGRESDETDGRGTGVIVGLTDWEMQYYGIQWTP